MVENAVIRRRAETLLAEALEIVKRYRKSACEQGLAFNVFDVLGRSADEVNGHSAIIAELLDPKGSHGQGARFLNLFLERLRAKDAGGLQDLPNDLEKRNWTVRREKRFSGDQTGRIDIALESRGVKKPILIIIENKIYAEDQERQLQRYWDYGQANKYDTYILYLTISGHEPSEHTVGEMSEEGKHRITLISYGVFVCEWMEDCIQAAAKLPHIRETLVQYQWLVRRLAGRGISKEMTMELADKISDAESFQAAKALEEAVDEVKIREQLKFWECLRDELCKVKFWERLRTEVRERIDCDSPFIEHHMFSEDLVKGFYEKKRERPRQFGLGFPVMRLGDGVDLAFVVEVHNTLYFGFRMFRDGEALSLSEGDRFIREAKEMIQSLGEFFEDRSEPWLLAWRGPHPEKPLNYFEFDDNCAELMSDEKRTRYVKDLVGQISNLLGKIASRH